LFRFLLLRIITDAILISFFKLTDFFGHTNVHRGLGYDACAQGATTGACSNPSFERPLRQAQPSSILGVADLCICDEYPSLAVMGLSSGWSGQTEKVSQ
jgi:hypothetical protein